jgi:hypothetical protein
MSTTTVSRTDRINTLAQECVSSAARIKSLRLSMEAGTATAREHNEYWELVTTHATKSTYVQQALSQAKVSRSLHKEWKDPNCKGRRVRWYSTTQGVGDIKLELRDIDGTASILPVSLLEANTIWDAFKAGWIGALYAIEQSRK